MAESDAPFGNDGWREPKRRKKRGAASEGLVNGVSKPRPTELIIQPLEASLLDGSVSYDPYCLVGVQKWKTVLQESAFWKAVNQLPLFAQVVASMAPATPESRESDSSLPLIDRIVCLGLGSMESSALGAKRARAQFAFLLLLMELFQGASTPDNPITTAICEPMFSAHDAALARHFGIGLLENRAGKYSQLEPLPLASQASSTLPSVGPSKGTLYWMPHCPKELYASLLHCNWHPSALSNMVIIGNSFADIVESPNTPLDKTRLGRIFVSNDFASAARIPEYNDDPFIFNSTSIHIFRQNDVKDATDPFWTIPEEETKELELCLTDPNMSFQGIKTQPKR